MKTRLFHSLRMHPQRRLWVMRITVLVAAPVLVFGLLEATLRLSDYGYPTGFLIRNGDYFESNDRFGWRIFPKEMSRTPCKLRIASRKSPGTYRVLILGESAAMGFPEPAFGFGRMLEAMLRLQDPERRVEVVNAAMTGINSHIVRQIAYDCRQLQPDLVVVYMGNNEVVGPYGPGTVFGRYMPLRWIVRASLWVRSTKTGQLLQNLLSSRQPSPSWKGMEMFLDQQVAAHDPRLEEVYANFRANLSDICNAYRTSGTTVIVATVATNLKDCPPFASQHRRGFANLERWQMLYESGIAKETQGHHNAALEAYEKAAALDDSYAELHFRMGNCYQRTQAADKADNHFRRARDLDALRFRADSQINSIIREFASQREDNGTILADAEATLAGDSLFYEHVHLQPRGNYLLARLVCRLVSTNTVPSETACAQLLALTDYDKGCMQAEIANLTAKAPFTNQLGHAERQALRLSQLRQFVAQIQSASQHNTLLAYESALGQSPEDFYLHDNFARFLVGSQNYARAAEHKKWVLDRFPRDVETMIALARIRMELGQYDQALTHYRTALAMSLDQAEIHKEIGEMFIRQGRFQEAVSELEEAVLIKPNFIPAINALGVAKLNMRDLAGAGQEFERILQQQPDLTAHINLASVLYQQGKREAAIEHLNIALTLTDDKQIANEIRRGIASYQR